MISMRVSWVAEARTRGKTSSADGSFCAGGTPPTSRPRGSGSDDPTVGVALNDAVTLALGRGVAEFVGVAVSVKVAVGVHVRVGVAVCVTVGVAVFVNVGGRVGVSVGRGVDVSVGRSVGTGVAAAPSVAVGAGGAVGVSVGASVGKVTGNGNEEGLTFGMPNAQAISRMRMRKNSAMGLLEEIRPRWEDDACGAPALQGRLVACRADGIAEWHGVDDQPDHRNADATDGQVEGVRPGDRASQRVGDLTEVPPIDAGDAGGQGYGLLELVGGKKLDGGGGHPWSSTHAATNPPSAARPAIGLIAFSFPRPR